MQSRYIFRFKPNSDQRRKRYFGIVNFIVLRWASRSYTVDFHFDMRHIRSSILVFHKLGIEKDHVVE
jgi:hypothetical protein